MFLEVRIWLNLWLLHLLLISNHRCLLLDITSARCLCLNSLEFFAAENHLQVLAISVKLVCLNFRIYSFTVTFWDLHSSNVPKLNGPLITEWSVCAWIYITSDVICFLILRYEQFFFSFPHSSLPLPFHLLKSVVVLPTRETSLLWIANTVNAKGLWQSASGDLLRVKGMSKCSVYEH